MATVTIPEGSIPVTETQYAHAKRVVADIDPIDVMMGTLTAYERAARNVVAEYEANHPDEGDLL